MATRSFRVHDVMLPAGHILHYYEWGDSGTNLVLLHGSGSYALQWEWVAEHLNPQLHVLAIDQRGHGDSGRPDGEYSAQVYAAEYPRQCTAAMIFALHLSNFFQDRERMTHVLQSAWAMLQSPTEFA